MAVNIETLKPGDGKTFPKSGQTVYIHFVAKLPNGIEVMSSGDKEPYKIQLGKNEIFKAAEEALMKMSLGQRAKVTLKADAIAGAMKNVKLPPIPPNTSLVFEVELVKIE